MSEYRDKGVAVHDAKGKVEDAFSNLHPTDKAEAFRELGKYANARGDLQDGYNEHDGVPERSQDRKEPAISERMDGGQS